LRSIKASTKVLEELSEGERLGVVLANLARPAGSSVDDCEVSWQLHQVEFDRWQENLSKAQHVFILCRENWTNKCHFDPDMTMPKKRCVVRSNPTKFIYSYTIFQNATFPE
jgi:hypothetical protein